MIFEKFPSKLLYHEEILKCKHKQYAIFQNYWRCCMDIILLQTLPDHTTKINTSFFSLPKHFFSQFSPFMQSDKIYLMYFEKWHRQFMGTNFTRAHGNVQHDSGWILIFNFITWFLVISLLTINYAVKTTTGVKPLQETWLPFSGNDDISDKRNIASLHWQWW